MAVTFADLFCGIGGFRKGIEDAAKELNLPVKCVFSSEIEKNAVKIYEKNFRETPSGDITKIDASKIEDMDILCGGFPCQAFSIAGKRRGFDDTRGTLFFEIARIARDKRPKIIFLENVKGLLNHDKGRTFGTILITLDELGYDVEWQVLNSKDFGVPQNRERVFIVGHLRGERIRQIFPIWKDAGICERSIQPKKEICQYANTLTARQYASWNGNYVTVESNKSLKYIGSVGSSKWLDDGKDLSRNYPQGNRVYSANGITPTLSSQSGGLGGKTGLYQLDDTRIRKLTPLECERLQSYPDGWTEGVSDSARYKCLGNAVTVNVIKAVALKLLKSMR